MLHRERLGRPLRDFSLLDSNVVFGKMTTVDAKPNVPGGQAGHTNLFILRQVLIS